ncbi:hypothetical protein CspHIS471_0407000 [Cutaneotrichosporon sp. HIS471]|nr:hypothetical protein CspHIS471_0407000 [Cutaneotrichosporon sp. HIS471]
MAQYCEVNGFQDISSELQGNMCWKACQYRGEIDACLSCARSNRCKYNSVGTEAAVRFGIHAMGSGPSYHIPTTLPTHARGPPLQLRQIGKTTPAIRRA